MEYTIDFFALSRFGNMHSLGRLIATEQEKVDKVIEQGKQQFCFHLRKTDNMKVCILDESGEVLDSYTFEPIECKK